MPSNFTSLTVDWYDATDSYVTTADITADVKSLPLFTDTGTGEVNQATIVLRAKDGKYIDNGNIIDKYDRFHIQVTDLGSNNYDRFFEVMDIMPSQSKGEGTLLTLECLGTEYHTQHIHVAKPFYFENGNKVAKEIGDMYAENKGSAQPSLVSHNVAWNGTIGNALPDWTANNFEYGLSEDTAYNRWMDLIDKFGASVAAGGALTFYELSFVADNKNNIRFRLRASGDNTPTVTIKNAKVTNPKNVGDQEGEVSNPTGTNVLAWGSPDHGSLPVDFSKYDSYLVQFAFRPEYSTSVKYTTGAKVKVTQTNGRAKHYKSLHDDSVNCTHTPPASGDDANWERIDMKSEFGDSVQYSPWTDGKAAVWDNCFAAPTGGTRYAWDMNLVVWDEGYFRTWVDGRLNAFAGATDNDKLDTAATDYSYDGTRTKFPRGFRLLVDDASPAGDLSGFGNQVVEYTGSAWQTKYSFTASNDKIQIAVIDEAKVYEGDAFGTTPTWTAKDTADYGNDCFHPVTSISNVDGIDLVNGTPRSEITDNTTYPDIVESAVAFTQNVDSAIKFTYTWPDIISTILGSMTGASSWYKRAAIACFRFPFPPNTIGVSEGVGDLYGGGTQSQTEPATLDIQNMHNTHDGLRGFNQGASSEDLGQISAIAFWTKFDVESGLDIDANHQFRCFMIDTSDNIVYSDYEVQFSDHWQDIRLPISSFRMYRGRRPAYGLDNAFTLVPPKDLDIVNIFEWKNIRFIGIQWLAPYDQFGRFNPSASILNDSTPSVTFNNLAGGTVSLYIDAFRFIKPLLVTSGQDTTTNVEPTFLQRPGISVYHQLLNDAKSQLEVEKFQHKEFSIETSGDDIFDINFGDSFLLENNDIVYVASPNGNESTNKIQLVAKRIEYSITKPPMGAGGLRRRILGVKVFT